jgi:uncharacterized protein YndB with AHSA1/START domain
MTVLAHTLERTIVIRAKPDLVFRFFTDPVRWAGWWGAGSSIEPTPGGRVHIRYPDGTEVAGEVVEVAAPERIVFTYGYVSGKLIPPGGSRVTIRLDPDEQGTRLLLRHEFADAGVRDHHVQGWRYQLSLFSNIVANEANAGAGASVDAWFAAWTIADDAEREGALNRIAARTVTFRDRFSSLDGLADLLPHIAAAIRFMPGMRLQRTGAIRHCQGTVLADWTAIGGDGQQRGRGTNVFVFGFDGRINSVVGFWN